ncbi:hypothetical protein CH63R_13438 [Colletotrichum higginsianum IMI 349063]|uniref:Uncharacterized protein n=1 Tax=Colletotrichum higginsianum (strain IMI 349063) TaxID=759273 RepID=A0A1B7XX39_COLHI|nr:hypothetical protein CH63R_13438 [Colletotrichum higginsianum IMI 349063]OBR04311.1 hypothetical protein CH63R_13438 [Colletotrichum higginsianum IMI 349063]
MTGETATAGVESAPQPSPDPGPFLGPGNGSNVSQLATIAYQTAEDEGRNIEEDCIVSTTIVRSKQSHSPEDDDQFRDLAEVIAPGTIVQGD